MGPREQRLEERKWGRREASRSPVLWESSYKKKKKNLCTMGPPKARMKKPLWSLYH